jgi:membrane protein implicated in regulation of membrane protease activity
MIFMLAPILALPMFHCLTLENALPIYIMILAVSIYCNGLMVWSMRAKAKGGVQAMIGKRALVVKDIDPLGQITLWGEISTAAGCNEPIRR